MHESAASPTPHAPTDTPPRVAFQGELGAFSEMAISTHWPNGAMSLPSATFRDAVARVLDGEADFAVIPVENVIAGVVHAARAALDAAGDSIVQHGEVTIPIHLCLMAPPGATLDALRVVRSHDIALAQCERFFADHPWLEAVAHDDTAGAARVVSAHGNPAEGAVAAEAAAERYSLEILARRIEDLDSNRTRFVVIRAQSPTITHPQAGA